MDRISIRDLAVKTLSAGAGRTLAQILNVFIWPLALAFITPADFGRFSILQIAALAAGVVMSLGLAAVYIARFARDEDAENLLGRMLGLHAVLGAGMVSLLMLLSPLSAQWIGGGHGVGYLRLLLLSQYFGNVILIFGRWQILTGHHPHLSIVASAKSLAQLSLIAILVIWLRLGLLGLVVADLGPNVLGCSAALFLGRRAFRLEFRAADLAAVVRYGFPAIPDPLFYWLIVFLPLLAMKTKGLLALAGAFSLGWRLMSPIDLLGNSLASAAADRIVAPRASRPDLSRWYRLSITAIVFCTLGIMLFSSDILHLFFSASYGIAIPLLPLMGAAVMFLALYYFEWIRLNGSGRTIGLSLASGAGLATILVGMGVTRAETTGTAITVFFSSAFLAMWIVARIMNRGDTIGHWFHAVAPVALAVVLGSLTLRLPFTLAATAGKLIVLGGGFVLFGSREFVLFLDERRKDGRAHGGFLAIPNYAEVATRVGPAGAVLDIGCSEGFFLGEIDCLGLKVGVDSELSRLQVGRLERQGLNFVCADAAKLPFPAGRFGVVVLIGVLPYLNEPPAALKEVHRVLASFGQIEVSTASDYWLYRALNIYNWKHHVRYFSRPGLEAALNDAGFAVKRIYSRGRLLTTLTGNLFPITNRLDRLWSSSKSVLGPCAVWTRQVTNPIIQWEYDHHQGQGYQLFASGARHD